jgi:hypothetical protein
LSTNAAWLSPSAACCFFSPATMKSPRCSLHILAHGIEEGQHVGHLGVFGGHLGVQVVEDDAGHLAVEFAQAVAQLALPARRLGARTFCSSSCITSTSAWMRF